MLIEHIADFHIRNAFGMAPLHVAAGSPGYGRDRMIDHGADPNVRGSTPLHHSLLEITTPDMVISYLICLSLGFIIARHILYPGARGGSPAFYLITQVSEL